jgi:hypothetical protein
MAYATATTIGCIRLTWALDRTGLRPAAQRLIVRRRAKTCGSSSHPVGLNSRRPSSSLSQCGSLSRSPCTSLLNADMFAEMGKRFSEQDPQQMGKMMQDMFSKGWFGGRRMVLLPFFQWISRVVFAYVGACIVVSAMASNPPLQLSVMLPPFGRSHARS